VCKENSAIFDDDIAEIEALRDIDMAIVFGTTLAVHCLWWKITTWDFV